MTTTRREFVNNGMSKAAGLMAMGVALSAGQLFAEEDVIESRTTEDATNNANKELPPPSAQVLTLGRTSFGIKPEELSRVHSIGIETYLEEQLDWQNIDDSAVESYLHKFTPTIYLSQSELIDFEKFAVSGQLKSATVFRALYSQRQLYEVMVEFWSNHFSIYHQDGPVALLKTADDRDVIRPHALGNFKELLHASSKSPAMLVYLDNHTNVAGTANENYARELMELHTLGVDGGYTEQDVKALSRCLTGWGVGRRGAERGQFKFYPKFHDEAEKELLGISLPANGGVSDGETVIDLLAEHPSTAAFIAQKLVRRFVSDSPPSSLVSQVADAFLDTGGDIQAMLWIIFLSDEFLQSSDEKLKRPLEYMGSALRGINATLKQGARNILRDHLISLGQMPFDWVPPNGYPDVATHWASTNGMLNRWNFSFALARMELRGIRYNYFSLIGRDWRPVKIVDALTRNLLHRELLEQDRQEFIEYLAPQNEADNLLDYLQLMRRVPGLIGLMLSSDYFQYR